jgi:transposase
MISAAVYYRIQQEFHEDHQPISDIARRLGLAKRTVAKWTACPDYPRKAVHRCSKLDAFKPTILKLLWEHGLSVAQIHKSIQAEGYCGGYSILKNFVAGNQTHLPVSRKQYVAHQWLHKVMQGYFTVAELQEQLAGKLGFDEVAMLAQHVESGSLLTRNKAAAVLGLSKRISIRLIARFLLIGCTTLPKWCKRFEAQGMAGLFPYRRVKPKKSDLPEIKEAVFSILHAPPSDYGLNRTTWRMEDIVHALKANGVALSKTGVLEVIRKAGYRFRQAKKVLTSNDPNYRQKLREITNILHNLKPDEKFFSVDEFGPFAVKRQGGRSRTRPDELRTVPQYQTSKGSLILTAALELSANQVTHFFSEKKNTAEMLKLLELLVLKYADQTTCIYFSWDAASWHASKKFVKRVEEINSGSYRASHKIPMVKLAPLPSCAQFLNVIESVFSGMARAIIHNSDYQSAEECKAAIDRYFTERNQHFKENPKRAGKKIWGQERVPPAFNEANNCKDPRYQNLPR